MNARRHVTLALAALALGGGLTIASETTASASVPADAAPVSTLANCRSWGATGSAGDIVGAYAHGEKCELDSGRIQVDITIEDTESDGRGACAQLHAIYADGGTRDEWIYVGGFGKTKSASYTFASSVRTIWAREGLGNNGTCTEMAPKGVYTVWN